MTLTGTGGIGKTRLALETARQLVPFFADGVFLVQLASLVEPELVISTIGQVLKLHEQLGYSATRSPLENLQNYLNGKIILLVIDNFEQLLAAGSGLITLLEASAGLRLLVTSRVVLHLYGEQELNVPLLSYPQKNQLIKASEVEKYEAIRLLLARVKLVKPGFKLTEENSTLLTEICQVLEGLPLALELVAPRLKLLSPAALLSRFKQANEYLSIDLLADGPHNVAARHQTMRNTLDWSYRLLTPEEQRLFRYLGVFSGGCTLEEVAAVYQLEKKTTAKEALKIEREIQQLLNHSLLYTNENGQTTRLNILVTLREYALEKLEEAGESAQARERHALYFLKFVEAKAALFKYTIEESPPLDDIAQELDNLRAAQEWALLQEKADYALRFGGALGYFWQVRGFLQEGHKYLSQALALTGENQPANRAKALCELARMLELEGDYTPALEYAQEGLTLWRQVGDKVGKVSGLTSLANVLSRRREYASAHSLYEEALALEREIGNKLRIAATLGNLGLILFELGDYGVARGYFLESVDLISESGNRLQLLNTMNNLGNLTSNQGLYEEALGYYTEALAIAKANDVKFNLGGILTNLGIVSYMMGDYKQAEAYYLESLPLHRTMGRKDFIFNVLNNLGELYRGQGKYETARRYYLESLTLGREMDYRWGIAICFNNLGNVATQQGKYQIALDYIQQSLAIRQELGIKPGIASCFHNLGDWSAMQEQFTQAIEYYRESLSIRRELNDRAGLSETLIGLALTTYTTKNWQRAIELLREGLILSLEIGTKLTTVQGLTLLTSWILNLPDQLQLVDTLFQHTQLLLESCGGVLPSLYLKVFENTQKQVPTVLVFRVVNNAQALDNLDKSLEDAFTLAVSQHQ